MQRLFILTPTVKYIRMTDKHMQLPMCGQRINKQMRRFCMWKNTQIALIPLNAKRPYRQLHRDGGFHSNWNPFETVDLSRDRAAEMTRRWRAAELRGEEMK